MRLTHVADAVVLTYSCIGARVRVYASSELSNGVQTGPPIGFEEGPPIAVISECANARFPTSLSNNGFRPGRDLVRDTSYKVIFGTENAAKSSSNHRVVATWKCASHVGLKT